MDYDSFCVNTQLVEACVFNLSQMGELVGRLDEAFIEVHSDIPWRAMQGLRNRIVHDYDGVNLRLVWDVIVGDLPELKTMLTSLTTQKRPLHLNCTPIVRQYGILNNDWGDFNAKGSTEQALYARIQSTCD